MAQHNGMFELEPKHGERMQYDRDNNNTIDQKIRQFMHSEMKGKPKEVKMVWPKWKCGDGPTESGTFQLIIFSCCCC